MPYGTSTYQARIRNDPASWNAANLPVDALTTADTVANNLDHYADSFGQVRVNIAGGSMTPKKSGVAVDTWYQIMASEPFPIPLLADGRAYKLRVRIGGFSTSGQAVKFRVVLAPVLEAAEVGASSSTDAVYETTTTTSTTAVWLTGVSKGGGAYTTMMEIGPVQAAQYTVPVSTPVDLAGAASAVPQCLVALTVYGSTANVGSEPTLVNLYAAEWPG